MPTRWMRWNETSHIFEYSTDGVAFGQLPLDAAILTQGIIDPARLPGGSGLDPTAPVDWTGQQTLVGVAPSLRFTETDQAANAKTWDIQVDALALKFRSLTDAFAGTELMSLSRAGVLKVTATGAPTHELSANVNGANVLNLVNTFAGASAYAGLRFANNVGAARAHILLGSNTLAIAGYVADALNINSGSTGGININASGGSILIKTADVTRMTISNAGAITFQGSVSFTDLTLTGDLTVNDVVASGTIRERGRAVAMGEPIIVAHNAAHFTATSGTWTVEAGDLWSFWYTIIGKSMIIAFDIVTSSVSATPTDLRILIPGGYIPNANTMTVGHALDQNIPYPMYIFAGNGTTYLSMRTWATTAFRNWGASTNTTQCRGQIIIPIQ